MQGTLVRSLVWEDSTRTCVSKLLKFMVLGLVLHKRSQNKAKYHFWQRQVWLNRKYFIYVVYMIFLKIKIHDSCIVFLAL